jgi:hypothetical protein
MNSVKRKIISVAGAIALLFSVPALAQAGSTDWTSSSKLYEVRTWAGKNEWGNVNGAVGSATFFHPRSIVSLPDGRLLVADKGNHVLRILTAEQVASYAGFDLGEDEAGLPIGAYNDGPLAQSVFQEPAGLAVDAQGNIYVADSGNHAIRKITPDGTVTTLAGNGVFGLADGLRSAARFDTPNDVAVDASGNVYVADTLNHVIRKITPAGRVTTLTAPSTRVVEYFPGAVEFVGDFLDGPIASARFNEPSGLVIDDKGNLYVSDRGNQRIRYIDFSTGQVTTVAGGGNYGTQAPYVEGDYIDGPAQSARFNAPEGLALTPDGTLVVADSLNHVIRLIRDGQVTTLAGVGTEYGHVNGVPGSAQFNHPTDVAVLADGRLVIADEFGNKIRILQKYAKPDNLPDDKMVKVLLNGALVQSDVPAQLKDNWTFLPLRSVSEALGYTVTFETANSEATLSKDGIEYKIASGSATVTKSVNGSVSTVLLNAPAFIQQNRMLVPVRFFAEESGLDIQWDQQATTVVIRNKTF